MSLASCQLLHPAIYVRSYRFSYDMCLIYKVSHTYKTSSYRLLPYRSMVRLNIYINWLLSPTTFNFLDLGLHQFKDIYIRSTCILAPTSELFFILLRSLNGVTAFHYIFRPRNRPVGPCRFLSHFKGMLPGLHRLPLVHPVGLEPTTSAL